jgi:hypothetical protein
MSPFELIALKQKVGREYADEAELFVLVHFDAARRGRCDTIGYNFISRHLVMAQYIFAKLKAPDLLRATQHAADAWRSAGERPTKNADLTTPEYIAMRHGLHAYFRALPRIEAGTYRQACNVADQVMSHV